MLHGHGEGPVPVMHLAGFGSNLDVADRRTLTGLMKRRARQLAVTALVAIGIAPVCAALIDYRWGFAGAMTGASPMPLVFDAALGYEPWACQYEVTLNYSDGTRQRVEITPNVMANLPQPHWPHLVHVVYALPFALSPVMHPSIWGPPLRAALCRESELLRALGARGPSLRGAIEIKTKASSQSRSWRIPYRC